MSTPKDILSEDFELSDSEFDPDFDLKLKDFPEPYNSLGQFIVSTITGAIANYIIIFKNKQNIDYKAYHSYINKYFNYCKNTTDDLYINEINSHLLKYDCNLLDIIDQLNATTIYIADDLMLFNNSYSDYINTKDDINLELLNSEIAENIISILDLYILKRII